MIVPLSVSVVCFRPSAFVLTRTALFCLRNTLWFFFSFDDQVWWIQSEGLARLQNARYGKSLMSFLMAKCRSSRCQVQMSPLPMMNRRCEFMRSKRSKLRIQILSALILAAEPRLMISRPGNLKGKAFFAESLVLEHNCCESDISCACLLSQTLN